MPGLKGKRHPVSESGIWGFIFPFKSGIGGGVPKVFNLEKKPRQSTDLEEYDFKVPKNFI